MGRATFAVGPSAAFEVACDSDPLGTSGYTYPVSCHPALERRVVDWSAVFGGGFEWDVRTFSLLLESRYHVGLVDLDDRSSPLVVKSRAFTFVGGISVPVGPLKPSLAGTIRPAQASMCPRRPREGDVTPGPAGGPRLT